MTQTKSISHQSSNMGINLPKHHNHNVSTPLENSHKDDYSDASPSGSQYESDEDESGHPVNDGDDFSVESESLVDSPDQQFSSRMSKESVPKIKNFNGTNTLTDSSPKSPNFTPALHYMNIAPFPIFHGTPDECPITHLSRFIKVCRANNACSIDMMMRIFPVTLENEAALWYDLNIEPYPSLSWEEIKSSFLEAYNRIEIIEQLRYELMTINQGSEECIRSYFLRLQWVLKRWPDHGMSDNLLKGIFVDGLRDDFRDWIMPQKPESLNEALRLAFSFEQVKSIRTGTAKQQDFKCGFCEGAHEERACEVKERMRNLWRKYNRSGHGGEVLSKQKIEDLVFTGGNSSVDGKNNDSENEKEEEETVLKKSSQCKCGKHQCWKKPLERNSSILTRNSDKQLERNSSVVSRNSKIL